MTPVRLEPAAPGSRVKHSTTKLPWSFLDKPIKAAHPNYHLNIGWILIYKQFLNQQKIKYPKHNDILRRMGKKMFTILCLKSLFRPKLKFYSFPFTRPTLKKDPTKKKLFQFQSRVFFKFHCKLRELSNVNSVICKFFVYLTLLPIVGLYSKTCLNRPLKDIHNKGHKDKWALNVGQKYCRSILQYFSPALCDNRSWKTNKLFVFLSGLLRQVLLYTIKFNGYPIWEVKKIFFRRETKIFLRLALS